MNEGLIIIGWNFAFQICSVLCLEVMLSEKVLLMERHIFKRTNCLILVPSVPPANVTVLEKTSTTSLLIQWMKVPDNETNGHLTGYVVSYQAMKVRGKKVVDEVVKKRTVGSGTYSLVLDDLQSFTTYDIRVAGLTRRGEGVYSQSVNGGWQCDF